MIRDAFCPIGSSPSSLERAASSGRSIRFRCVFEPGKISISCAPNARPISEYSSSGSTIITRSSGYFRIVGITSLAFTNTDLPDPDDPKTTPDAVFRSR